MWVLGLSIVAVFASIQPVGAAQPLRQYSLGLSTNPTDIKAGHPAIYTVTLSNSASSTATIGAADLTVNSAFTSVGSVSASSAAGTWTGALSPSGGVIQLRAATGSDRLDAGESVTVSFTATAPCTAGNHPIFTSTLVGTLAGTWNFTGVGAVPSVAVSLTPTSLSIGSITDADGDLGLAANEPFNVVVNANANVDCNTLVTLTETGAGSFTSTPTGTIPVGQSQVTISATYGSSDSGFNVCASAAGLTTGCQEVNVAIDHDTGRALGTSLTLLAGGPPSSGPTAAQSLAPNSPPSDPCDTNASNPTCVFVTLPDGTNNTSATLAVFECQGFGDLTASDCPGGQLILFLGDEATIEDIYSITNFYLMTVECDQTVCGRGGVSSYVSFIDPTNTGLEANFIESPACTPSVNDAIDPPTYGFCTDYNASSREGPSHDLILVHRMAIDYGRK